jgi:propanol-preferring alcohol dehydrogenase
VKAVLLHRPGPIEQDPLSVEEVPVPVIGRRQVLIKVGACGVCRSNLHMIEGDWVAMGVPAKSPIIPGHEVTGRVSKCSEDVDTFKEGDRVGIQPLWSTCGRCEFCLTGRENICQSKQVTGETVDGGFAEYVVAGANHVYRLPDNLKDSEAAPLFCPGITAYGAVKKAELRAGKRVAVFGVGGVGHMVIEFARLNGADVIAVSRSSRGLTLAKELGASEVVDISRGNREDWLKRIGPVDSSIIFAPSNELAQLAMKATKPGGITVVGVFVELGTLPFTDEKRVVGSVVGSRQDMIEVLRLASDRKIRPIYEEFKLEMANKVLKMLKTGRIRARAVLVP